MKASRLDADFKRIVCQHAALTGRGAFRRCNNGGKPDNLTGTSGDDKVIFRNHDAAMACVRQLRREIPGFRIWAYKCSRGRRHHHITSQPHPRPDCPCKENHADDHQPQPPRRIEAAPNPASLAALALRRRQEGAVLPVLNHAGRDDDHR